MPNGDVRAKVAITTPSDCVKRLRESLLSVISRAPPQPVEPRAQPDCGRRTDTAESARASLISSFAGVSITIQQSLCGHDHAIRAVTALRSLLIDERLLQRVRLLNRTQSLKSRDLVFADVPQGDRTRSCRVFRQPWRRRRRIGRDRSRTWGRSIRDRSAAHTAAAYRERRPPDGAHR